jgi:hypothetical protein
MSIIYCIGSFYKVKYITLLIVDDVASCPNAGLFMERDNSTYKTALPHSRPRHVMLVAFFVNQYVLKAQPKSWDWQQPVSWNPENRSLCSNSRPHKYGLSTSYLKTKAHANPCLRTCTMRMCPEGEYSVYTIYVGRIFTLLAGSTALRFTATGAPLAARRIRILPTNQHGWRPVTFGM